MLNRKLWMLLPLAALPLAIGCGGDAYPESLRYPSRRDPIINPLDLPRDEKGGASLKVPDRPGVFPVMSMAQLRNPEFPLHIIESKALDPRDVPAEQRAALQATLEKVFGTPAHPTVDVPKKADGNPEDGWDEVGETLAKAQEALKLDAATLATGSKLYRLQCLHCHGLSGDGRGPTAFWVNPHPRDYRLGAYKFTSTALGGTIYPQHADLVRTLKVGVEGTAMPAFNLLPQSDLEAMASYVVHLSIRGQVEREIMTRILNKTLEGTVEEDAQLVLRGFAGQWIRAQGKLLAVADYPYNDEDPKQLAASVKRGELYWKEWQCNVCHMDYGRTASFSYDAWGTLTRPANLTLGYFRGGRRPVDLYWRVLGGVNGANMPANDNRVGPNPKVDGKNDQIWDIINYLQVLPYRSMRDQFGIMID